MTTTVHYCANCGNELEAGAHFCGVCGHALPGAAAEAVTQPQPTASPPTAPPAPVPPPASVPPPVPPPGPGAAYPPPGPGVPPPSPVPPAYPAPRGPVGYAAPVAPAAPPERRRGGLYALIGVLAVLLVGALVFAVVTVTGEKPAEAEEFLLEPVGYIPPDPFTPSAVSKAELPVKPNVVKVQPPVSGATGGQQVAGGQAGLYGGSRNNAVCDPEKLIAFLQSNTDKAKAWAGVLGIGTTEIPAYVRGLTPVVLTRDTRVTNHGFTNGQATTIPAVLQAGTAVMVDKFGVPRVKCGCGNPLTEPRPLTSRTTFKGNQWNGFTVINTVQITINVEIKVFVLVDIETGSVFNRPPGISVSNDSDVLADDLCQLFPTDPSCTGGGSSTSSTAATTSSTAAPTTTSGTPPAVLAEIGNIGGVQNGPTAPSVVTLGQPSRIVEITTYHWNGAKGAALGTVSLRGPDGTVYGPFSTRGADGQGGVPNAYWIADVDLSVPAGAYEVLDSDPSTWAQNSESGGRGFTTLRGYTLGPPVDPTTTAAPTTTRAPTVTQPPAPADRGAEASNWVRQQISGCAPETLQYITSITPRRLDRDTLYEVSVHIVLDSGEWYAHFEVDFATEDFPEIRALTDESQAFMC